MAAVLTEIADRTDASPFVIRAERPSDVAAREALLDASFGENRHARTCQRLREGRLPADGLAFTATRRGRLIGTVRLWHVSAGGVPALVLGPLAVDASCRKLGTGAALMTRALGVARACGYGAVILLGDAPYYSRFGFSALMTGNLSLPGPFEPERLLALELRAETLAGATGLIAPVGLPMSVPRQNRPRKIRRPLSRAA
jgi:predicted N-acetyltransferase YhbS